MDSRRLPPRRCGATAARPKTTESTARRTPYQGDRKISYVSYHTRAISMGITKAESRTLIDPAHHAKGRLCRMRVGAPAALA